MRRTNSKMLALLAAVLAAVALGACGSDDGSAGAGEEGQPAADAGDAGTFKLAIDAWLGFGPWHIAKEKGYFDEEGIDVELVNFTKVDDLNAAFASGRVDGSNGTTHTSFRLKEQGVPLKIPLLLDVSTTADAILAGPGIDTVEDLRGKSVAYEEATTADILLRYALSEAGMTIDDVKTVPMKAADAGAAAIAGRVDAAVTWEPFLTTAIERDPEYKILYSAGEKPGLISNVLWFKEDVLEERGAQVEALVRAWDKAVKFYRDNTEEGQEIIARNVGSDPASLASAFEGVEYYDLEQNLEQLNGPYKQVLADVQVVTKEAGLIKGETSDPSSLLDLQFIEAAAESGE